MKRISEEELREKIRKATPAERKHILEIETWYYQGESYTDYCNYEIIYGDAYTIELETINEGHPHRVRKKYAIIPKTIPTIVRVESYNDYEQPEYEEKIYVSTKDGWKHINVY